jgi:hypothetical protein
MRRDKDRARRRHLLDARGEVRRLPDGGVVHPEIAADRAHHDISRVQADADLDRDSFPPMDILGVATSCLLHA